MKTAHTQPSKQDELSNYTAWVKTHGLATRICHILAKPNTPKSAEELQGVSQELLDSYLDSFYNDYNYKIVRTDEKGPAAGLKKAVSYIPDGEPFIVTWSDLFFEKEQEFTFETELLVGLSNTFKCRWIWTC